MIGKKRVSSFTEKDDCIQYNMANITITEIKLFVYVKISAMS